MQRWILKTEPETFSIDDLRREGKTPWNGVRNYQARNYIATMQPGDIALIYHSGKKPCIVGQGAVASGPYPDLGDPKDGRSGWLQADIRFSRVFPAPIPLENLKKEPRLASLKLFRQSRLSVVPITEEEYSAILAFLR